MTEPLPPENGSRPVPPLRPGRGKTPDPAPGKSILVLEDDPESRTALAEALEQGGYTVRAAAHGQEALDQLRAGPPPDLILVDLIMPVFSGWDFRRLQREDPALAGIPVIVLSAVGEPESRADALGDVAYLQKPVDVGELLAAVARFTVPRKPEVLVVEDDAAVRNMLAMALRHFGFAVRLAGSGPEAVEEYRRHHPLIDVVLLDVQMPGVGGAETFAALREINPSFRCCFMSGSTGRHTYEELLALGAACVLPKPFPRLDHLAQTLWRVATGQPP